MLTDSLLEFLGTINHHFFNANKRLFWGYVLSSCLFVAWVWYRRGKGVPFLKYCFPKRVWLHPSARMDYWVWLINLIVKSAIIVPLLFSAAPIAIWLSQSLETLFGPQAPWLTDRTQVLIVFTVLIFLLDDFTRFLLHWLMHKVPALWHLHAVHHSAQVLTPFTVYRLHPLESALYACRLVLAQGLAIGLGFYLFGRGLAIFDVLGANLFVFLFNLFGSNLRHSHVWLSWGDTLENWFISPAQHQIHHSADPMHHHKNLGSALAIWDRLFGTHMPASVVNALSVEPSESAPSEADASKTSGKLQFGFACQPHASFRTLYLSPVLKALKALSFRH